MGETAYGEIPDHRLRFQDFEDRCRPIKERDVWECVGMSRLTAAEMIMRWREL